MKQIKIKHFPDLSDIDIEIHAKDMLNRDGIFSALNYDEIYPILDDVFAFLTHIQTQIIVIAILMDKSKINNRTDIEIWAHRMLFERINSHIHRQNMALIKAGYPHEFCLMLTDSEGQVKDEKLRGRLINMIRRGTRQSFSEFAYLIEFEHFRHNIFE